MSMSTLNDIAKKVGVTPVTVSRVLSGTYKAKRHDALKRAAKIREVASEMGYRINVSARAMRHGRFGSIALLMSKDPTRSILHEAELNHIHDALASQRINLVVARMDDDLLASNEELPKVLTEHSVDGLLINYKKRVPEQLEELILRHHIPAIWMGRKLEHDAVYYEYFNSVAFATKQLIQMGHERICMAHVAEFNAGYEAHYSQHDPEDGYAQTMHENGLEPQMLNVHLDLSGISQMLEVLTSTDRPTAMLLRRHGVLVSTLAAVSQLGLRLPEDLSLIQIGHEMYDTTDIPKHCLRYDYQKLAEHAVKMLVAKIQHPQTPLLAQPVPLRWQPNINI